MPVIGRLDEQVNEVLIKPLEKGGPQPASDLVENSDPGERVEDESRHTPESRERDSLPVWML